MKPDDAQATPALTPRHAALTHRTMAEALKQLFAGWVA